MRLSTVILSVLTFALPAFSLPTLQARQQLSPMEVLSTCECTASPNPLTPPALIHFITNVWAPHSVPLDLSPGTSYTIIDKTRKSPVTLHIMNDGTKGTAWSGGEVTELMNALRGRWEDEGCMLAAVGIRCGALEGAGVRVVVTA